jgi:hypothetical protein
LQACGPLNSGDLLVFVTTDESGRITERCLAGSERPVSSESLACLSTALDGAGPIAKHSLVQSPLRIFISPLSVRLHDSSGLSRDEVMETIKGAIPQIQQCVAEHRRTAAPPQPPWSAPSLAPPMTGKAVFAWRVLADGTVADVELRSRELEGTIIASCLSRVIAGLMFPAHEPPGEEPIVFPFKF